MSIFTNKLKAVMVVAGIDFATLSKKLSIGKNSMSYWESNGNLPKGDTIKKIADYFNIPIEYFLGTGVFADWDNILAHRKRVEECLSIAMGNLSNDILNGIDETGLIRLVQAFGVRVTINDDGTCGVTMDMPFATYSVETEKFLPAIKQKEISPKNKLIEMILELSNDDLKKVLEYADFVKSQRKP